MTINEFYKRATAANVTTATVKDDSPRGVKTVPIDTVMIGDFVVLDNEFVLIEDYLMIRKTVVLKDKEDNEEYKEFLRWSFVEYTPAPDHYGNGYYICACREKDHYTQLIDCRYIKGYEFEKTVQDFLMNYYGAERVERIEVTE